MPSSVIVIDANLAVQAVVPGPLAVAASLFADWRLSKSRLVAPDPWLAEALSAVRGLVFARALSRDEGLVAVDDLFALGVELAPLTLWLCRSALSWAERLGQAKVYDSLYLALAEQLQAEFWTADRRLANRAQKLGADWVHVAE